MLIKDLKDGKVSKYLERTHTGISQIWWPYNLCPIVQTADIPAEESDEAAKLRVNINFI